MSIFKRMKNIVSSNVNAALDSMEDPSKMIDQTLRDLHKDLENVRKQTAEMMAQERMLGSEVENMEDTVKKLTAYAEKAIKAGNDDDARRFLKQKNDVLSQIASKKQLHTQMVSDVKKLRDMQQSLANKVSEMDRKKSAIKLKNEHAKAQERMNKITSSVDSSSLSKFDEYEKKIDAKLYSAQAMEELNKDPNDVSDLMIQYDSGLSDVDDELAALKASMNSGV